MPQWWHSSSTCGGQAGAQTRGAHTFAVRRVAKLLHTSSTAVAAACMGPPSNTIRLHREVINSFQAAHETHRQQKGRPCSVRAAEGMVYSRIHKCRCVPRRVLPLVHRNAWPTPAHQQADVIEGHAPALQPIQQGLGGKDQHRGALQQRPPLVLGQRVAPAPALHCEPAGALGGPSRLPSEASAVRAWPCRVWEPSKEARPS